MGKQKRVKKETMGKFNKQHRDGDRKGGDRDRKHSRGGGRDRSDSDNWKRKPRDGDRRKGGKEPLKVERRDQSKLIKKGGQGKKISIESLRRDDDRNGKNKGNKKSLVVKKGQGKEGKGDRRDRGDRRERDGRRPGKFNRKDKKGGKRMPRDPAAKADALDKEMESYWVKGGHTDLANQRLDDDLNAYFEKEQAAAPENGAAEAAAATNAAEEKKE